MADELSLGGEATAETPFRGLKRRAGLNRRARHHEPAHASSSSRPSALGSLLAGEVKSDSFGGHAECGGCCEDDAEDARLADAVSPLEGSPAEEGLLREWSAMGPPATTPPAERMALVAANGSITSEYESALK